MAKKVVSIDTMTIIATMAKSRMTYYNSNPQLNGDHDTCESSFGSTSSICAQETDLFIDRFQESTPATFARSTE